MLLYATPARADGGDYSFEGGTRAARTAVRAALDASSFDWDVVPLEVTIHIRRGVPPHATPGEIWLDPRLLAAGRFAWGIVQHEYAHQVAFFAIGLAERRSLTRALDARAWCHERAGVPHDAHACEQLAELVAWAYWPSRHNIAQPSDTRRDRRDARRLIAAVLA